MYLKKLNILFIISIIKLPFYNFYNLKIHTYNKLYKLDFILIIEIK